MDATARFKIGAWTVSPALNLIERGTRSVRIEPRSMDVLVFLARHDGDVVSVEQLIAAVWKGVVVGDGSVYLAISQLRQALDDAAEGTRYIETIPKRGYRLTVPVVPVPVAEVGAVVPDAVSAEVPAAPPVRRRVGGPLRWWLGAAVVAALISIAVVLLLQREPASAVAGNAVAVLPFDNLSSDPEQAYFADGITAEVLSSLSRVRDLRVIGRTSAFRFRDRNESRRAIGAALGVEHILEGSVRKAGDRVRVTAQLSNARTGDQLWSETYERQLGDIFLIQDEIAKAVADALQVKLGVGDLARVPGMTRNVAAYDEYLRGTALNIAWQADSFPQAIAHMQRAVALDPSFSIAWAGLHTACVNGAFAVPDRAVEWREKARDALDHARALTPEAPHVLLEMGIDAARRGSWLEAAAVYDRLQASYARHGMASQAWGPRGIFLLGVGRVREAIDPLERARAEDPLAPAFASFLGEAELARGNLTAAFAEVDRGLALEGLETSLAGLGLVVALTQRDRAEIERRLALLPEGTGAAVNRRLAVFLDGRAGAAAEIRELAATASAAEKAGLAQWAAYYGDPELSLGLLAEAASDLPHPAVLWQPLMREARRLPAFNELVRQLGFVEYWRKYGWPDACHPAGERDFRCE